jgi:regulatory protein
VPTITALREDARGRVAVELDGAPWRMLPVDVVARAGLAQGRVLDRPALRLVRRELRRAEALDVAARALRQRNLSQRALADRLAGAGVTSGAAEEALDVLARAGLVDDARVARNRAEALARRGYGDVAIRAALAQHGVENEPAAAAVAELEPEVERARAIVAQRGPGPRTARYLASKGFGGDALETAAGVDFANDP